MCRTNGLLSTHSYPACQGVHNRRGLFPLFANLYVIYVRNLYLPVRKFTYNRLYVHKLRSPLDEFVMNLLFQYSRSLQVTTRSSVTNILLDFTVLHCARQRKYAKSFPFTEKSTLTPFQVQKNEKRFLLIPHKKC